MDTVNITDQYIALMLLVFIKAELLEVSLHWRAL